MSFADRVRRERAHRPPARGFADRVRRERGGNLFLVRGHDSTGRAAWYFVLVDPGKRAAFRRAASGPLELSAYGRVVTSGYGTDPPDDVRERMRTEYGFTGE